MNDTAQALAGCRVLVTGGSGFVGRALLARLAALGARCWNLSRHEAPAGLAPPHPAVHALRGSVADTEAVATALEQAKPELVFHLAAQPLVGLARQDPSGTFEINIAGTWRLLDACRRQAVPPRVVMVSSDQAYGPPQRPRVDESHPLAGRQPYDVSKSCADLLAQSFAHTYGLPLGIARLANVFGPGDLNFSRLVPGSLRAALAGEPPLIRSDGTPTRDIVALPDVVDALLALAGALHDRAFAGRAYNIASGRSLSVLAITRLVLAAAGRADIEPTVLGESPGEVHHKDIDITAAARDLAWAPSRSLPERLAETAAWYREHESLWRAAAAG